MAIAQQINPDIDKEKRIEQFKRECNVDPYLNFISKSLIELAVSNIPEDQYIEMNSSLKVAYTNRIADIARHFGLEVPSHINAEVMAAG